MVLGDKEVLRRNAVDYFDINKGVAFYFNAYEKLHQNPHLTA